MLYKTVINQLKQFRICMFFHLIHAFKYRIIRNKSNLVEMTRILFQTGETNMYLHT